MREAFFSAFVDELQKLGASQYINVSAGRTNPAVAAHAGVKPTKVQKPVNTIDTTKSSTTPTPDAKASKDQVAAARKALQPKDTAAQPASQMDPMMMYSIAQSGMQQGGQEQGAKKRFGVRSRVREGI